VTRIADNVLQLAGARRVSGNLTRRTVRVGFDPGEVTVEEIIQAIERSGGDLHRYVVEAVDA